MLQPPTLTRHNPLQTANNGFQLPRLIPQVEAPPASSLPGLAGALQIKIGEKIRTIRVDHRLTQKAFADRIAVNVSYVGPLEKGIKTPSIQTLDRIAQAFNLPISYFFLEHDDPDEAKNSTFSRLKALLSSRSEEERSFLYRAMIELVKVLPEVHPA